MTQTAVRSRKSSTRKASTPTYEPTVLARCYDKETGQCLGYRAPSSDPNKDWYHITCDAFGLWHCDCEAGQHGQKCCHVKAIQELCEIRALAAKLERTEAPASSDTASVRPHHVLPVEPISRRAGATERRLSVAGLMRGQRIGGQLSA